MSDTPEAPVTLRELVEQRFEMLEAAIDRRFAHVEQTIDEFKKSNDDKHASMNEIKEAMKDQAALNITRAEAEAKHESMESSIDDLKIAAAKMEGKASQTSVFVGWGLTVVSIIIAMVALLHGLLK